MNSHGITKENLLFTFPAALQHDTRVKALGEVTAEALARRPAEIDRLSIYPRIDELPEDLLDILAYDFKVDWYDYAYPIDAKRALIKGNILAHKRQGTVYATRSVLDGLYPKSQMEEWFQYGGKPGYFRLNVNITDSAEEGAVIVYSTEEILRRIATVKRLSAHLEGISYMVRRGIVIRQRMDAWTYRVPECGTLRCGMWWTPHTLGWSERRQLTAKGQAEPFGVSPELSGTLPVVKTPGYSLRSGLHVSGQADAYPIQPQEAGVIRSGTEWTRRTLGWSEQAGALVESGQADTYNISPELAGTLPNTSKLGYALVCGTLRSGGVIDTFRNSPKEAGKSEKTGTQPETATAGHSVRAGAVRAGGGAQAFKAAPELTGTLPDAAVIGRTITGTVRAGSGTQALKVTPELTGTLPDTSEKGCTITGALSTGATAEGFKITPEVTGTLEAHHGERED